MKKDQSQKGVAIWIAAYQWHLLAHSFQLSKYLLGASKSPDTLEKPIKNSSP